MPIYEYECPMCGLTHERLRDRKEADEPAKCLSCSFAAAKRIMSPAAAHFKGSGFYETDYKRKSRKDS